MIKLTSDLFIAKGTERNCYIHPNESKLCVKVSHSHVKKQHNQELSYINFLLKKNKLPCDFFPNFYGTIETNQGEGLVFERIYNEDGSTIENLKLFIKHNGFSEQLENALIYLKSALLKQNIIVRDLRMINVLVKKIDNEIKLIIVDGIGNSDFIPLANYVDWYSQKKIQRHWARFEKNIIKHINDCENLSGAIHGSLA